MNEKEISSLTNRLKDWKDTFKESNKWKWGVPPFPVPVDILEELMKEYNGRSN